MTASPDNGLRGRDVCYTSEPPHAQPVSSGTGLRSREHLVQVWRSDGLVSSDRPADTATEVQGKVTGSARCTADVRLPGMLGQKVLHSSLHARSDSTKAERVPEVPSLLTGADVRGVLYGAVAFGTCPFSRKSASASLGSGSGNSR